MRDSGYDRHAPIVPRRAAGYSRVGESTRNAPYVDIAAVQAAGALYSTVEDLSTWDDALTAGKLLTPELYEKLYTPGKGKYAYGWVVENRSGRRYLWHTGAIDGFSSYIVRCPEERSCVVVLSNFDSGAPHRMGNELMAIAFGEEYRLPRQHQAIRRRSGQVRRLCGSLRARPRNRPHRESKGRPAPSSNRRRETRHLP